MDERVHVPNGTKTAMRLGNTPIGSGHDNFLNGIIVHFRVNFTIKAWTEAERYHFLDFISSTSTMHTLKDVDLTCAYNRYVDDRAINVMIELQDNYKQDPSAENLLKLLYTNPCGMRLAATMTTNYRQLKTIYTQRKNHRLPEWREFCDWCLTLPMFADLCLYGRKE